MFDEMDREINASLVNEESSKYQLFGTRDHTFEMNDEERKKYEEVGKKIENLTKELEIIRKGD